MKKMIAALSLALLTVSASAQNEQEHYIEVTGWSEISLAPDTYFVNITISEEDSKGRYTVAQMESKMIAALRKAGIDTEKSLKLSGMSSSYERRNKAYTAVGYTLELGSVDMLSKSFKILDDLSISKAYLERTASSKMAQARKTARREAVENAESVAQELAEATNQSLGDCIYIYDLTNDYTPQNYVSRPYLTRSNAAMDSAETLSEPLEMKEIKLSYRVKARFLLEAEK